MLIVPIFLILGVAFVTILLSILTSRPQRNSYSQNKDSQSYQTFFFGSFDLVGSEFRDADFNTYSAQLDSLLKGGKQQVYNEIYKEVFNVRKVLNKNSRICPMPIWPLSAGLPFPSSPSLSPPDDL